MLGHFERKELTINSNLKKKRVITMLFDSARVILITWQIKMWLKFEQDMQSG